MAHFEALVRWARFPLRAFSEEAPEETRRLSDCKSTTTSYERSAGDLLVVQSSVFLQSALRVCQKVKQMGKAVCVSACSITHDTCLDQFRDLCILRPTATSKRRARSGFVALDRLHASGPPTPESHIHGIFPRGARVEKRPSRSLV